MMMRVEKQRQAGSILLMSMKKERNSKVFCDTL